MPSDARTMSAGNFEFGQNSQEIPMGNSLSVNYIFCLCGDFPRKF